MAFHAFHTPAFPWLVFCRISVDGQILSREYSEEVNGSIVKHPVAEIHASKIQRLIKGGAPAPSDDQASDE
ncbi:MAG: hypothetical protein ABSF53_25575 [Terracidiphilus sp.]